ncbi:MAG: hypothetical protein U1E65_15965 [Myxococcota bacterium]
MRRAWSAPGKVLLLGEYGVLAGGRALVAAVNRRALGTTNPAAPPPTPVVETAIRLAEGHGCPRLGEGITIDTRAFYDGPVKLGLGSSAAAALIATALATESGDEEALELAIQAHRVATGGGSGVDVAASFYGGVIAAAKQPGPVSPLPSRLKGLELSILGTGQAASTSDFIQRVQAWEGFKVTAAQLARYAEDGILAWSKQDAPRFLSTVALAGRALDALGKGAGVPIVTPAVAEAMRIAGIHGAALKPSGAGGGDVAVLFAADPGVVEEVVRGSGLVRIDAAIDPIGLKEEPADQK